MALEVGYISIFFSAVGKTKIRGISPISFFIPILSDFSILEI